MESNQYVIVNGKKFEVINNTLDLSQNKIVSITEVEGLDKLPNLEVLILMGNRISQISGLERMVNLRSLNLNRNKITKIEGINHLTKLRYLGLSHNKITEISGLDAQTGLEELSLSFNKIMEITGLEQLTNLRRLNLASNPLVGSSRRIAKGSIDEIRQFCKQKETSSLAQDLFEDVESMKRKFLIFSALDGACFILLILIGVTSDSPPNPLMVTLFYGLFAAEFVLVILTTYFYMAAQRLEDSYRAKFTDR